jgi:hypothetical protein
MPWTATFVEFTDGVWRAVSQDPRGRQYVFDAAGEPVYGAWFVPEDEPQLRMFVERLRRGARE